MKWHDIDKDFAAQIIQQVTHLHERQSSTVTIPCSEAINFMVLGGSLTGRVSIAFSWSPSYSSLWLTPLKKASRIVPPLARFQFPCLPPPSQETVPSAKSLSIPFSFVPSWAQLQVLAVFSLIGNCDPDMGCIGEIHVNLSLI